MFRVGDIVKAKNKYCFEQIYKEAKKVHDAVLYEVDDELAVIQVSDNEIIVKGFNVLFNQNLFVKVKSSDGKNPTHEEIGHGLSGDVVKTGTQIVSSNEKVDHPSHYNIGKFEVIDVIEDWKLNFNLGNAVKYIARCNHKSNMLEDLKKAKWYLDREINNIENKNDFVNEQGPPASLIQKAKESIKTIESNKSLPPRCKKCMRIVGDKYPEYHIDDKTGHALVSRQGMIENLCEVERPKCSDGPHPLDDLLI